MAQRGKNSLEPPSRGRLPGTRPLSLEEYECLATTHPYAVKHLAAKNVTPVLCADATARLTAIRVPTGRNAGNEVDEAKRYFALGNMRQSDRLLVAGKRIGVTPSGAQTSIQQGETKSHCLHNDGNDAYLQRYAVPSYACKSDKAFDLEQVAAGPVGEFQPFSKMARFPALQGSSTGHQGVKKLENNSSNDTQGPGRLRLHTSVAVTSPGNPCGDGILKSHLHVFQSPQDCSRCTGQAVSRRQLHSAKQPCSDYKAHASDSAMMHSMETGHTGPGEGNLGGDKRSIDPQEYGSYRRARLSVVVINRKTGEDTRKGSAEYRLPHGDKRQAGAHPKYPPGLYSRHDPVDEKQNSPSSTRGLCPQNRKYMQHGNEFRRAANQEFCSEALPRHDAYIASATHGAYSHEPFGFPRLRGNNSSNEHCLPEGRHYVPAVTTKQQQHMTDNTRHANRRRASEGDISEAANTQNVSPAYLRKPYPYHHLTNTSHQLGEQRFAKNIGMAGKTTTALKNTKSGGHAVGNGSKGLGSTGSRTEGDCKVLREREGVSSLGGVGSMEVLPGAFASRKGFSSGGTEEGLRSPEVTERQGEPHVSRSRKEYGSMCSGADESRDGCGAGGRVTAAGGEQRRRLVESEREAEAGTSHRPEGGDELPRRISQEDQTNLRSSGGSSMRTSTGSTATEARDSKKVICNSTTRSGLGSNEFKGRSQSDVDGKSTSMRRVSTGGLGEGDMRRYERKEYDELSHLPESASSASGSMRRNVVVANIGCSGKKIISSRSGESVGHAVGNGSRGLGSTGSRTEGDCKVLREQEGVSSLGGVGSMEVLPGAFASRKGFSFGGTEEGLRSREVTERQGEPHVSRSRKEYGSMCSGADESRDGCGAGGRVTAAGGEQRRRLVESEREAEAGTSHRPEGGDELPRRISQEDQTNLRSSGGSSMRTSTGSTATEARDSKKVICNSTTRSGLGSNEFKGRSQSDVDGKSTSMRRVSPGGLGEGDMRRYERKEYDELSHLPESASSASGSMRRNVVVANIGCSGKKIISSRSGESVGHAVGNGSRGLGSTGSRTEGDCKVLREREGVSSLGGVGSMEVLPGAFASRKGFSFGGTEEGLRSREVTERQGEPHVSRSRKEYGSMCSGADESRDGCGAGGRVTAAGGEQRRRLVESEREAEAGTSHRPEGGDELPRRISQEDQTNLRSSGGSSMRTSTGSTATEARDSKKVMCNSTTRSGLGSNEFKGRSQSDVDGKSTSMRRVSPGGLGEGDMRRYERKEYDELSHLPESASSASGSMRRNVVVANIGCSGKKIISSRSGESVGHAVGNGSRGLGSTGSRTEGDCKVLREQEGVSSLGGVGSMEVLPGAFASRKGFSFGGTEEGLRSREVTERQGEPHVSRSRKEYGSMCSGADESRDGCGAGGRVTAAGGEQRRRLVESEREAEAGTSHRPEGGDELPRRISQEDQTNLRSSGGSSMRTSTGSTATEARDSKKVICNSTTRSGLGSNEFKGRSQSDVDGKSTSMRRVSPGGLGEGDMRRYERKEYDELSHLPESASSASGSMRRNVVVANIGCSGKKIISSRSGESVGHAVGNGSRGLGSTGSRTEGDCKVLREREGVSSLGGVGSMEVLPGAFASRKGFSFGGTEEGLRSREVTERQGEPHVSRSRKEYGSMCSGADESRDGCGAGGRVTAAGGEQRRRLVESEREAEAGTSHRPEGGDELPRRISQEDQTNLRSSGGSSMRTSTGSTATEARDSKKVMCNSTTRSGLGSNEFKGRSQSDVDGKSTSMRRVSTGGLGEGDMRRYERKEYDELSHLPESASSASGSMRRNVVAANIGCSGKKIISSRSGESVGHAVGNGSRGLGSTGSRTEGDCKVLREREGVSSLGGVGSMEVLPGAFASRKGFSFGGTEEGLRSREVTERQGEPHVSRSRKEYGSMCSGADESRDGCGAGGRVTAAGGEQRRRLVESEREAEAGTSHRPEGGDELPRRISQEDQTNLRSSGGSSMRTSTGSTATEARDSKKVICNSTTRSGLGSNEFKGRSQSDVDGKSTSMRRVSTGGLGEGDMRRYERKEYDELSHLPESASSASGSMRRNVVVANIGCSGKKIISSRSGESVGHAVGNGSRGLGSTGSRTEGDCKVLREQEGVSSLGGVGSMEVLPGAFASRKGFSSGGTEEGLRSREVTERQGEPHVSRSRKEYGSMCSGADESRDGCGAGGRVTAAGGEQRRRLVESEREAEAGTSHRPEGGDELPRRISQEDQTNLRSSGGSSMRTSTGSTATEARDSKKVMCNSTTRSGLGSNEFKGRSQSDVDGKSTSMRRVSTGGLGEGDMRRYERKEYDELSHLPESASSASGSMRRNVVAANIGCSGKKIISSRSGESVGHAVGNGSRGLGSTGSRTEGDCKVLREREGVSSLGGVGSMEVLPGAFASRKGFSFGGTEEGLRSREVTERQGEPHVSRSRKEYGSMCSGADESRDGCGAGGRVTAAGGEQRRRLVESEREAEAGTSHRPEGGDELPRRISQEDQTNLRSSGGSSMRTSTGSTATEARDSKKVICNSTTRSGLGSNEFKGRSQSDVDGKSTSMRRVSTGGLGEGDMRRYEQKEYDELSHLPESASSASGSMRRNVVVANIGCSGKKIISSRSGESVGHAVGNGSRGLGSTGSRTEGDCKVLREQEGVSSLGGVGSMEVLPGAFASRKGFSFGGTEEGLRSREVTERQGEPHVSRSRKEYGSMCSGADESRDGCGAGGRVTAAGGEQRRRLVESEREAEAGTSHRPEGGDELPRRISQEDQTNLRSSGGSSMRNSTGSTATEARDSKKVICNSTTRSGLGSNEFKGRSQSDVDGKSTSMRRVSTGGLGEGDMRRYERKEYDELSHLPESASSASGSMRRNVVVANIGCSGKKIISSRSGESVGHAVGNGSRGLGSTGSRTEGDCKVLREQEGVSSLGGVGSMEVLPGAFASRKGFSFGGTEEGLRSREVTERQGEPHVSRSRKEYGSMCSGADESRDGCGAGGRVTAAGGEQRRRLVESEREAEAGTSHRPEGGDELPRRISQEDQTNLRGFRMPSVGIDLGGVGVGDASSREGTEAVQFETCRSRTRSNKASQSCPVSNGPLISARGCPNALFEEGSVKLSESTAIDKLAYFSTASSGNLASVLQSAVSVKSTSDMKCRSSRYSMVLRHATEGGDIPIRPTKNITASGTRSMLTSDGTMKALLECAGPCPQATTESERITGQQQPPYSLQHDAEARCGKTDHLRPDDQHVDGRCSHLDRPVALSSIPNEGSHTHGSTKPHGAPEFKPFLSSGLARFANRDVLKSLDRSAQFREPPSLVDKKNSTSKTSSPSGLSFKSATGVSSSRRSTGDLHSNKPGNQNLLLPTRRAGARMEKPSGDSAAPQACITGPSCMDATAVGRRLTAQNNMWSAVGSYEPLASVVFQELYPQLSRELQALCMQCLGTTDSPELRALTDIQQAAMKLVAEQSARRSIEAKSRLAEVFKREGQPKGALESLEQFLLERSPILIYFDIVSLTPHLEQGGFFRSHFEIPQTDATYLRKCNERELALYCGLYEHESVRPEHHPKYGYVSVNCKLQPPWEPHSGEACIILKDHVRVRATISANQCDGAGVLSFGHEPLVATLNNPWHVLEPLGHETLAALAAFAKKPTSMRGADIPALVDCNIHGEIKLGKDVEAIALPNSATRDKATFAKLREIATQHMVPILSMEKCPRAVKDDCWKQTLRHLQHEVLLKKTALGYTYGQI